MPHDLPCLIYPLGTIAPWTVQEMAAECKSHVSFLSKTALICVLLSVCAPWHSWPETSPLIIFNQTVTTSINYDVWTILLVPWHRCLWSWNAVAIIIERQHLLALALILMWICIKERWVSCCWEQCFFEKGVIKASWKWVLDSRPKSQLDFSIIMSYWMNTGWHG